MTGRIYEDVYGTTLTGLAIEVTRKCNLNCDHCCRGESQDKSLNTKKLNTFLRKISWIDSIFLTGGECFIVPDTLQLIYNILYRNKVGYTNIALVTNAVNVNDKSIEVIKKIFDLAEGEGSYIHVSKDKFHGWDENREKNYIKLKSKFDDVSIDSGKDLKILKMGKASEFGDIKPDRNEYPFDINWINVNNKMRVEIIGDMFFSINGTIHRDWEMTYKEIDSGVGQIISIVPNFKQSDLISEIRKLK